MGATVNNFFRNLDEAHESISDWPRLAISDLPSVIDDQASVAVTGCAASWGFPWQDTEVMTAWEAFIGWYWCFVFANVSHFFFLGEAS